VDIIDLSALLTTTMPEMQKVIEALEEDYGAKITYFSWLESRSHEKLVLSQ
jgi:cobalamin-dependent methionine synthase I